MVSGTIQPHSLSFRYVAGISTVGMKDTMLPLKGLPGRRGESQEVKHSTAAGARHTAEGHLEACLEATLEDFSEEVMTVESKVRSFSDEERKERKGSGGRGATLHQKHCTKGSGRGGLGVCGLSRTTPGGLGQGRDWKALVLQGVIKGA